MSVNEEKIKKKKTKINEMGDKKRLKSSKQLWYDLKTNFD